ncbi:MAG: glycosyltransferase family 2 protein [Bacteroidia bacterium]|nr:glycosyltransferase family 2 protein [Bacteroidia bacterium]
MKNKNEIAILLASYNGEKFIAEQLESIISQTNKNWTLYINDDGSTDATLVIVNAYIKKYPYKIYLLQLQPKTLGASANFFKILDTVESDYYMFCDQDDIWLPDKVEKCFLKIKLAEAEQPSAPFIVHTDLVVVDSKLNNLHSSFHQLTKVNPEKFCTFNYLGVMNCVTGCTMLFNRKAKELAKIPKDKNVWHDWWLAVNVAKQGKILYLNEATILYRQHSNNVLGAQEVNLNYFLNIFMTIKKVLRTDYYNLKNLRALNYGGFFKYCFYKFLFQIKRMRLN